MSSAWRALKSWSTSARRLNLSVRWAHPFHEPCSSLMYFLSFLKSHFLVFSPIHTELLNQNIIHRPALHQCFPCSFIHVSLHMKVPAMTYTSPAGELKAQFLKRKAKIQIQNSQGLVFLCINIYFCLADIPTHLTVEATCEVWWVVSTGLQQPEYKMESHHPAHLPAPFQWLSAPVSAQGVSASTQFLLPLLKYLSLLGSVLWWQNPFPLPASKWQPLSSHSPVPTWCEYHASMWKLLITYHNIKTYLVVPSTTLLFCLCRRSLQSLPL